MENVYCVYTHKVVTDDNGPMWYVGVTRKSLTRRWGPSRYKKTSLWAYIEKYGWHNIEHRVIFYGLDREMALKLEDFLILMYRSAECGINKHRSGHIQATDASAYNRKLYEKQKDERSKYGKQYYLGHKDEIKERQKKYYKDKHSTPEGKIYYRVKTFNGDHPDRAIETPLEAKRKYLEFGYVPDYIKHDDLG